MAVSMARRGIVLGAAFGLAVAIACDSPFEPRGEGERVPVGTVIEQEVTGDSTRRYSFAAQANSVYAVFLEAVQGSVFLGVVDSANHTPVASVTASEGGAGLEDNPTGNFGARAGAVYELRVSTLPAGASARFRFMAYEINTAPEHVPARFTIGDTVAGETIDPIVDGDLFVAHGTAGQEVVFVMETLGPPGSGSVSLDVVDPAANNLLGYVFGDAGPPTLTTGRLRLPTTQDYRFSAWSVTSNVYPRYRGPYRFWSYLIDRAPEHRSAAISLRTELRGEKVDRAGDVDEFTFTASAGAEYNAFVQAPRAVQLDVAPVSGPVFAVATSSSVDTGLFTHATGRFQVPAAGTYVVRVTGTAPSQIADTGAYRLFLYPIDHRPEHVGAAITPGDTVSGERIDLPGDIDEFTFSGVAGEEFNTFFQAENGSPETSLQLDVVDGAGTVLRTVQSVGTDTSLLRQVTGRFALPATGTYRLRVSGVVPDYPSDLNHGAYRLFVYRINRRPETLPATLAFGDSVSGEAIDLPGDVDEFHVTVPDSSGANLAFELESASGGGQLTVELVDSATGHVITTASTSQAGTPAATGRIRVAPGKYVVRVSTSDYYQDRATLRGPYRIWFYRFGFGPEAVSDTFAIGDTVSGEAIEPWGDDDQFHFYGVKGQHVNLMLQNLVASSSGGFQATVTPPASANAYLLFLSSGTTAGATLEDHQTTRVELPGTGWYTFDVAGGAGGLAERGLYRFTVRPVDAGPEHVSAALAVGDSVTTEPIDEPGDWDEFTVTATPDQDISILFDGRPGFSGPFISVRAYDPTSGDTLASQVGQFRRMAGPFRAPASGLFKIAVYQPSGWSRICYDATCGGLYNFVGPYGFHVVAINRAPENSPAAYTVGDTVRGEPISPLGDIDEFTSSGTPGEQLTLFDRLTVTSSLDSAIVLEVIDPGTGTSLVGGNTAVFGSSAFFSVGSFTVPSSGTFVVRAHVYGEWGYGVGTTSYEFFVKRGPSPPAPRPSSRPSARSPA